jgi:ABC-type sugar transport system permease subunit
MAATPIEKDSFSYNINFLPLFNLLFYADTGPYQAVLGLPLDTLLRNEIHFRRTYILLLTPRAVVIRSQCKAVDLIIIPEYSGVTTSQDAQPVLKNQHAASPSTNPRALINQLQQLCPIKPGLDQLSILASPHGASWSSAIGQGWTWPSFFQCM